MRQPRTFTLVLVLTAVLAGCGSDTEDDPGATASDGQPVSAEGVEDFPAALEARCMETNGELAALEEAFPGESAEDATGYFDGFADALEGFASDVGGMEAPQEYAEGTDQLVTAIEDSAAAGRQAADDIADGADIEASAGAFFATLGPAEAVAFETFGFPLSACGEEVEGADPDAAQVAVTATDYAFEIGDVAAGPTAFTMTNEGEEPHFMYVVRLNEGATLEEALAAEADGEDPDAFIAEDVGESATVGGGGTAVLNADLEPGTYGMLCFIPSPDGQPHANLGMAEGFVVE
ncbi:MAG: hypothetical protein WEB03_04275 [Nitriliruptor sp.]|uniref:hypothetical protein n=1 Tax=Nitriliruptor sp. TaxID=2448056 RepID=UPI0034A03E0D